MLRRTKSWSHDIYIRQTLKKCINLFVETCNGHHITFECIISRHEFVFDIKKKA